MGSEPPRELRLRRTDLFASPLFVCSVVLLLVNDWVLKPHFQNWLTGKLSDFAGLVAVTLFGCALAPRNRWWVACVVSGAFVYWKSPYSEAFIALLNQVSPLRISRTVDYSDLIAVPPVWLVAAHALRMRALSSRVWLQHAFAGVSLVVFTATSTIYTHESRESANLTTRPHGDISQNDLRELIDRIAARHGLDCSTCGSLIEGRQYDTRESGALSLVARLEPDSGHLFYEIASSAGKPDEVRRKEVDSLRNELVSELRARYPSLTIDKLGKLRPDTAQLLVYHTRKGSYRNPENVRDFEIARELVRASLLSYGIAPHGSSEVTEHYRFGGLVGRNARELTVYLWLGDSALGINVTRQTDRVREMQERVVNDLQGRLEREFGTKRIATDRF